MTRTAVAVALAIALCALARAVESAEGQAARSAADLLAARDAAEASYRDRLGDLADWCDEQGLPEHAALARSWLPVRDPLRSYIFKLSDSFAPPERLGHGGAAGMFWARFVRLRTAQSEALFDLARQAHQARLYALAFDLVRETCRENPDHGQAREILGYVRFNSGWALPDTARRLAAGQVDHEKFGWLPRDYVERYEQDRRYTRGKWISSAEDERLHSSIKDGWRIDCEHYVVTTNHSLEEGVRLSRRLEQLFDVWRHVFVDYYTPDTQMQRWFERADSPSADPPRAKATVSRKTYQVTYFRNREEYKSTLRPLQPQIDITLGIYFAQPRTAYFFAGDEQYEGTLLHEATHQLFQETRVAGRNVGASSNFALVEAVACYMESLTETEHWFTLGGADEGRVPAARKRLLEDRFYVPLAEVTALGMRELQRDERLPRIYSQISGQALFFLQADQGRYRRPLVETLIAIYSNRADAAALAKRCGRSYEQLDEDYRMFMQTLNDKR
jgi:hypothetical protein